MSRHAHIHRTEKGEDRAHAHPFEPMHPAEPMHSAGPLLDAYEVRLKRDVRMMEDVDPAWMDDLERQDDFGMPYEKALLTLLHADPNDILGAARRFGVTASEGGEALAQAFALSVYQLVRATKADMPRGKDQT